MGAYIPKPHVLVEDPSDEELARDQKIKELRNKHLPEFIQKAREENPDAGNGNRLNGSSGSLIFPL